MNRYNYCVSNPLNYVDKSGHSVNPWFQSALTPVIIFVPSPGSGEVILSFLHGLAVSVGNGALQVAGLVVLAGDALQWGVSAISPYEPQYQYDSYQNAVDSYIDEQANYALDKSAYYAGRCVGDIGVIAAETYLGVKVGGKLLGGFGAGGSAVLLSNGGAAAQAVTGVISQEGLWALAGTLAYAGNVNDLGESLKNFAESVVDESGKNAIKTNRIPDNDSTIGHIFRDSEGHIPDTPENRALLEDVANSVDNFRGRDKYGNEWYTMDLEDGRQVWVEARNGNIFDGGINESPKFWNSETGLKKP